jgi:hypothetical protein
MAPMAKPLQANPTSQWQNPRPRLAPEFWLIEGLAVKALQNKSASPTGRITTTDADETGPETRRLHFRQNAKIKQGQPKRSLL